MSGDQSVVLRMFEALSTGDEEMLRSTLTPDFRYRDWDVDAFVAVEFAYLQPFPDLRYEIDDIFASGDKVTTRWRFVGTHTGGGGPGLLRDVSPTGLAVDVEGIAIARMEHDLIAEWWGQWNSLAMHQALGVVPTGSKPTS